MIEPRPSVVRFVRAVVRAELARGGAAHEADVAQRILTRLHQELSKIIGPAGLDVLLARALVVARRVYPALGAITPGPGGTLLGYDVVDRDCVALREGAMAVVAHFVELLAVLIGEDMAMLLLHAAWPGVVTEEGA